MLKKDWSYLSCPHDGVISIPYGWLLRKRVQSFGNVQIKKQKGKKHFYIILIPMGGKSGRFLFQLSMTLTVLNMFLALEHTQSLTWQMTAYVCSTQCVYIAVLYSILSAAGNINNAIRRRYKQSITSDNECAKFLTWSKQTNRLRAGTDE